VVIAERVPGSFKDVPVGRRTRLGLYLVLCLTGCRAARAEVPVPAGRGVVVNECAAGPTGWIELLNRGAEAVDLAKDADTCWFVDDAPGGGSPKLVTDANVNHGASSTTCATAHRAATCAAVAPGEAVWLRYPFVNSTTPDACRLLTTTRVAGLCTGALKDSGTGLPARATTAGQCFGRQPDGAPWSAGPIACTPGASNGKCVAGNACDDGNACTTGEVFTAECECGAGTPLNGAPCGSGRVCRMGTCVAAHAGTAAAAVILGHGSGGGLLLIGTVVTPDEVIDGEVLVIGDEIKCVAPSCEDDPAVATASIVQTNGIIFPGLIDAHNHVDLDVFDETDWAPEASEHLTNHYQRDANKRFRALVDARQYLGGPSKGARAGLSCELDKFGELKGLIAGTTSIVGAAVPEDQKCYSSLARTIDQRPNGLSADKIQTDDVFPKTAEGDRICANQGSGRTDAYLVEVGDGTDDIARKEIDRLSGATTSRGCLLSPRTTIVNGAALQDPELAELAAHGMGLVWLPKSNVTLYGHGADLSQTANIPAALERGITVALGTDGSVSGSQNLLDELRFADRIDNTQWGDILTPKALVQMVTKNAAKVLGLQAVLGELAVGRKADIVVIGGDRARPYDALLAAAPRDVRLVAVGGRVLYGDAALRSLGQPAPPCDTLDVCGVSKFACVAQAGGSASDVLGQRYDDLRGKLLTELKKYDEKKLTAPFSPPTELCKCPTASSADH
jgi:5-methylthioadenosine/S-adenosylhomocysteine deaminase